jgi:hypothetical protein
VADNHRVNAPVNKTRDRTIKVRRWWPAVTALVVIGVAVSLLFPAARHQWSLSIFRQPPRYTSLSFDHPSSLPTKLTRNHAISFSFTIGNYEGRSLKYRYVIDASPVQKAPEAMTSMTMVAVGRTRTISVTMRPACDASPCQIGVTLPGHSVSIDFLISSNLSKDPSG